MFHNLEPLLLTMTMRLQPHRHGEEKAFRVMEHWEIWIKFEVNSFQLFFKLVIDCWGIFCEIYISLIVTEPQWWFINIGLDNGLVPSGNKPLLEPVVNQIYVVIWCHQATMAWCLYLNQCWPKSPQASTGHNRLKRRYLFIQQLISYLQKLSSHNHLDYQ